MEKSINDQMREQIHQAVREVQIARGRAVPAAIGDSARPIGDVVGFDAADGAEATRRLEELWSCPFGDNLFLEWKGTRPQTITEIVSAMMNLQAHGF